MLKIYNTLNRKKEIFKPINSGKINMYVCGVTIYDLCHIGHARTFINFDMISRYLRYIGYNLTYIRNITDIDDKIIKKAIENNINYKDLTKTMIINMHKDFDKLNILRPDYEPRVTEHIQEIIELIKLLLFYKNAYIANNGDVMFAINSTTNYGLLSKQNINKLYHGIHTNTIIYKKNKQDFVLWKKTALNEPNWHSPWGYGRPGWHIECSAMNYKYFGKHFDIHGGGMDLIFPHHENEIAQSIAAHKTPYVNYWIHTGMVMLKKEKISKSSNNNYTIRNILKKYTPETLRYFLLSGHYRKKIYFTDTNLQSAQKAVQRLYATLDDIKINKNTTNYKTSIFTKQFINAMNDDFNTPKVFGILSKIVKEINRIKNINTILAKELKIELYSLANVIGLLKTKPKTFNTINKKKINKNKINEIIMLIKQRNHARKQKDWKKADDIRNQLLNKGIILEDNLHNTLWKPK